MSHSSAALSNKANLQDDISSSVKTAFAQYLGLPIHLRSDATIISTPDNFISYSMGLMPSGGANEQVGRFFFSYERRLLTKFAEGVANGKPSNLGLDDVAGELTNVIFGLVRMKLGLRNQLVDMDLPKQEPSNVVGVDPVLKLQFESAFGSMIIYVTAVDKISASRK